MLANCEIVSRRASWSNQVHQHKPSLTAFVIIAMTMAAGSLFGACNGSSPREAAGTPWMSWQFATNAVTVDRNVRNDPSWRYLVFERHHFKATPGPTAAADYFEVVRLDLVKDSEIVIADSRGGSEPSVSADGAVLFRRGTKLILVNPATGKRKSMGLGAEFSHFMRPVVSPHGQGVVVIGERDVSSGRHQDGAFGPGQRIFLIDFENRTVKQISKRQCPPGVPEDVAWMDDHNIMVRNREEGEGRKIWHRATRIDLNTGTCSLAYFGDTEEGGRWMVDTKERTYAESMPRFGDTALVRVNDFGGTALAKFKADGKGGRPSCINEVLLMRPNPPQLVMSCKNDDTKGYNIALIDWRSEHASK